MRVSNNHPCNGETISAQFSVVFANGVGQVSQCLYSTIMAYLEHLMNVEIKCTFTSLAHLFSTCTYVRTLFAKFSILRHIWGIWIPTGVGAHTIYGGVWMLLLQGYLFSHSCPH